VRLSLITEGKRVYLSRKRGEKGPIPTLASIFKSLIINGFLGVGSQSCTGIFT
jgi:hypothetical protein